MAKRLILTRISQEAYTDFEADTDIYIYIYSIKHKLIFYAISWFKCLLWYTKITQYREGDLYTGCIKKKETQKEQ